MDIEADTIHVHSGGSPSTLVEGYGHRTSGIGVAILVLVAILTVGIVLIAVFSGTLMARLREIRNADTGFFERITNFFQRTDALLEKATCQEAEILSVEKCIANTLGAQCDCGCSGGVAVGGNSNNALTKAIAVAVTEALARKDA